MNVDRRLLGSSARYLAVAAQLGAVIVAGLLVGDFLDAAAGTAPVLTLLFTLGGFIGALRLLLWSLKRNSR